MDKLKRFNWKLLLIILLFLLKGIFLIFLIPPWKAPDESSHVNYVLYLYNQKKFPSPDKLIPLMSGPPLYYLYLLPFYWLSLFFKSNLSLIFLRFGSLFLGASSLVLVFKICRKLFPKLKYFPYIIVLLMSFQPMFAFISSVVNNDSLVIFGFLFFINKALGVMGLKKIPFQKVFALGFISGLSSWIKPQLIILLPLYLLLLFFERKKLRTIFCLLGIVLALIIFFSWYGTLKGIFYPFTNIQSPKPFWRYPLDFILGKQPIGIFMSFWGFFGWLDVPMPKLIYLLFGFLIVLSFWGWWLKLKGKRLLFSEWFSSKKVAFLTITFWTYLLAIFLFDLTSYVFTHSFSIQGRYLLPILPMFIILLVLGFFFYPPFWRKRLVYLALALFIFAQLTAFLIIGKYL